MRGVTRDRGAVALFAILCGTVVVVAAMEWNVKEPTTPTPAPATSENRTSSLGPVEYLDTLGFMFTTILEDIHPDNVPAGPRAARAHFDWIEAHLLSLLDTDLDLHPDLSRYGEACAKAHANLRALIRTWARIVSLIGADAPWDEIDRERNIGNDLFAAVDEYTDLCELGLR